MIRTLPNDLDQIAGQTGALRRLQDLDRLARDNDPVLVNIKSDIRDMIPRGPSLLCMRLGTGQSGTSLLT
jgi:hypothetical protein